MVLSFFPPIFKFISVEPVLCIYAIAYTMLEFGNTNLYLQKACRINQSTEPDLETPCDDVEKGVTVVASINACIQSVRLLLIYACAAFYSTWSDIDGRNRRLFLLMAPAGAMLESAIQCFHIHWWSLAPIYAALSSAVLQISFNNPSSLLSFGYIYLSDIVDSKNRTMRLGIYSSMKFLGIMVGRGVSGFLLHSAGFLRYYSICFVISLVCLICGFVCIEDTSVPTKNRIMPWSGKIFRHIFKSFKITLARGNKKERIIKNLLLIVYCLLMFVHEGQFTVIYLYLKYKFDWNEVMYGLFLFYGCIGMVLGTLFSSVVLSKLFKIHDALIGIIASLWDAAIAICYIFAFENWQLYMGHLFAVKQIFSLSIPFCHPVYNILFKKTLHTFPTAFYFVSFGLYVVAVIIYCIIYTLEKLKTKSNSYNLSQNGGESMITKFEKNIPPAIDYCK